MYQYSQDLDYKSLTDKTKDEKERLRINESIHIEQLRIQKQEKDVKLTLQELRNGKELGHLSEHLK